MLVNELLEYGAELDAEGSGAAKTRAVIKEEKPIKTHQQVDRFNFFQLIGSQVYRSQILHPGHGTTAGFVRPWIKPVH